VQAGESVFTGVPVDPQTLNTRPIQNPKATLF
jgi:hypothetical protein